MRKNFPFLFRTSLLQIYRLPLFLSLYTWSRESGSVLPSPLIGCLFSLRLNNLSSLILSFQVMNLNHLVAFPLNSFQYDNVFLVWEGPQLDTILQMDSHKCWTYGEVHLPAATGNSLASLLEGFNSCNIIHQLIFLGTASYPISTVRVVISSQRQGFALASVELHGFSVNWFLQPGEAIRNLQPSEHSTQWSLRESHWESPPSHHWGNQWRHFITKVTILKSFFHR